MTTAVIKRVGAIRNQIETALNSSLPEASSAATPLAPNLIAAMRYSTLAGGKRLRPLLCIAAADAVSRSIANDGASDHVLGVGCAIELIHTYSLIHDDLPAMDDDKLRRGKPTCHVQFNEAEAILAGDALQALAFEILSTLSLPAEVCVQIVRKLTQAIGWAGMVGGQSFDLELTALSRNQQVVTQPQLESLHAAKTGALLQASVELGAIAAQPDDPAAIEICGRIGARLGLAFQVIDDVLDVSQSSQVLGKDSGSDASLGKTTFIDLLGEAGARNYAHELFEQASSEFADLPGSTNLLEAAAREVVYREN